MLTKIPTQFTEELFESLGLTLRHATIYYALLKLGETNITKIARHTSIPRTTIYELMNDLNKKNVVNYVSNSKRSYYIAQSPQKLSELIEKQISKTEAVKKDLDKYLRIMQSEYANASDALPKVKFYEGEEGIDVAISEFYSEKELFVIHVGNDLKDEVKDSELTKSKELAFESKRRKISLKEIFQVSKESIKYKEIFENDLHEIKLFDLYGNVSNTRVSKYICKNKIVYVTFDSKTAILIEDSLISNAETQIFLDLWNRLK